ncbi:MAG TPA: hypothetical protein VFN61_09840 [Acidimicrobiales bacterium]|nr:hypothetical protein [Acidimicrobiales bacterium]
MRAAVSTGQFETTLAGSQAPGEPSPGGGDEGSTTLQDAELSVSRHGHTLMSVRLQPPPSTAATPAHRAELAVTSLAAPVDAPLCVADFGGRDPVNVILLGLFDTWTKRSWVYAYSLTGRGALVPLVHQDLGSPRGATVEAVAGHAILLTADNAFVYVFAPFAGSAPPVRVLSLHGQRFVNATRGYPSIVSKDARMWWHVYSSPGIGGSLGVLAAWVADECVLGKGHIAWATVRRLQAQGSLSSKVADGYPSGAAYVKALRSFLKKRGYCAS